MTSAAKPMFDLAGSEGVNESERVLTQLCRKSFLRLWSQTNVFTDEGFKDGKGGTKELCDALVVFGDDVIIFSDKHVVFQADKDLKVAWPRWYKRAVRDSCRQLYGARSWLQRFPSRAFQDAKCTRPIPVPVPPAASVRFHLIAVTRGSREAALAHNRGEGAGSFALNSNIEGDAHHDTPFAIGLPEPEKHFVHVFDEVSIELLLSELDTAADFLDYLKKRQVILGRRGTHVIASGEEELLGAYLRNMNADETEHVFVDVSPEEGVPDLILFESGHFEALKSDPAYRRKKEADRISYEWDALVDRFLRYGDPTIQGILSGQAPTQSEQGLRLMAAEPRYRRRQLAESFIGALRRAEPGKRLGRLVYRGVADETVFVFVVAAKKSSESYDEYRRYRIGLLHAYVQTAKLRAPLGTTFVGLAFDNQHKDYQGDSEDLFVISKPAWTEDELAELETKRQEFGLWSETMEMSRFRQDEFPQANQRVAIERISPRMVREPEDLELRPVMTDKPRQSGKEKTEKRRRKMQQTSKRRNRGRK
ncbi:MAG TPA: hypothetical protein PLU79_13135 [Burkholderiaceae bacterium]|nr:hypothetical protein [Burkholderiaceae bacterium]HNB44249.1 hypothetical protein [Burkholderiaceae bacterium]